MIKFNLGATSMCFFWIPLTMELFHIFDKTEGKGFCYK